MGKRRRWLFIGMISAFLLTGCTELDRMITLKEDFKAKETGQQAQPPGEEQASAATGTAKTMGNAKVSSGEGRMVSLYFSDEQGKYLMEEKRVIPKDVEAVRRTVQELTKGPAPNSKLLPALPAGTQVRGLVVDDKGTCTVDFSKELVNNHSGGSTGETLTVYSIVDTLTQFDHIKKVRITVEGKAIETIAGHLDVSEAMARNSKILEP